MWHVKGGSGVQLTKKDEQPDAADPAFSKDGRFLYFSARDARYRYDRNVNEGIWQIKRLDRWNGQTVADHGRVRRRGGPRSLPDGTSIAPTCAASARRRCSRSSTSRAGRTAQIASDLQRDNQEGFSFHGVFPGYAFTPDGGSIVATGGREDLASSTSARGARTADPLHAPRSSRR